MNVKITLLAATAAALLCLPQAASAQMRAADEPARPSTDSWAQIQYGEVSPSLYTGTVHLSVPFYTYKDPDFEIPVSFDYASNGCLPNDPPGILGPGWTLNAGGVISRDIRGIPDDETVLITENSMSTRMVPGYYAFHTSNRNAFPDDVYCADAFFGNRKCIYALSGNELFDAEPDIFHFNFLGHSGSFHLGPEGKVFVYGTPQSPDGYKIEFDFMVNSVRSGITITTPDGYRYIFLGYRTGDRNTEMIYSPMTILSWHLSRIEAPNGRTVTFSYDSPGVLYYKATRPGGLYYSVSQIGTNPYGTGLVGGSEKHINTCDVTTSCLSSVKVDGTEILSFSYTTGNVIRSYKPPFNNDNLYNAYSPQLLLTEVDVKYEGNVIKRCSLAFDGNTKSKTSYLTSLSIDGVGTFSMDYYNKQDTPYAGNFKIDHWGYYNGYSGASTRFMDISTLDSSLDETILAGNPREPNGSYAQYGILTKLTYPTGGWTSFSYEPHTYSFSVKCLRVNSFNPSIVSQTGVAGGVRICSVSHFDSDGSLLDAKSYSYRTGPTNASPSSGILAYMPRYKLSYTVTFQGYVFTETGTLISNNLTHYGSTHIEYSDVFEQGRDGSRIHYHFTTSKDPSRIDYAYSYEDFIPDRVRLYGEWDLEMADPIGYLFLNTSLQRLRGKLSSKEFLNTSLETVATEQTQFIKTSAEDDDYVPRYLFYCVGYEPVYIGREDIGQATETHSYGSSEISRETSYSYNSFAQRISQTVIGSREEQQITRWTYVSDYAMASASNIYRKMYDAGQIDRPVVEAVYTKAHGESEVLVSSRTMTYLQPDAINHPALFCIASVTEHDGVTHKNHVTNYSYDKLGRILQKTDPAGISSVYVWGYNGLYPVAQIVGATLAQVKEVSGLSGIENAPLSGALSSTQVSALRNLSGTEVTTWEYAPLVGLTKETTPDGRSTSYTYNASGKLHQVLDDLGRKTAAYLYSPDNKQQ